MNKKNVLYYFEKISIALMAVVFGFIVDLIFEISESNYLYFLIGGIVLFVLLVVFHIITIRVKIYKEISVTPINNISSRYLYKIFINLEKMFNKLNRCHNKKNFTIKVPYYDREKRKVLLKSRIITDKKDPFLIVIRDEFLHLKRILLELGQDKLRIKVGIFLKNYFDFPYSTEANIDYIGWTKLLNENSSGKNDILTEIKILKKRYDSLIGNADYENANDIALKISRAYRHLGTTYYTYRFLYDTDDELETYLDNAIEWLCIYNNEKKSGIHIYDAFLKSKSIEKYKKQYTRLAIGIKYNSCLKKYYSSLDRNNQESIRNMFFNDAKKEIEILYNVVNNYCNLNNQNTNKNFYDELKDENLIEEFIVAQYADNHRKVKIYSLYAEIFADDSSKAVEIANASRRIKEILDDNIYIDEAMELFVFNEINVLNK